MDSARRHGDLDRRLSRNLLWVGVVTLLTGLKLVLSAFVPGLKTPGELVLSGGLLLVTTVSVYRMRAAVRISAPPPPTSPRWPDSTARNA